MLRYRMLLSGLSLQHFRNYSQQTLRFSRPITLILAPNASGKSNLLEAIHFLSLGRSFRAATIDDVILVGKEYGRIKAKIHAEGEDTQIEMLLTHGSLNGKRTTKRHISINDVKRSPKALVGLLPTVCFIPEDLRLITGSPSRRREFVDTLLSQLSREYLQSLHVYEQTLKRRNKLLYQIREGLTPKTTLAFWTQSLLKHGEIVQHQRLQLFEQFNQLDFPVDFSVEYLPSIISPERLQRYAEAEIAAGHTLVGPHKDDFTVKFYISSTLQPLSSHGSRGQQRLGVLWLKLNEFQRLKDTFQTPPLLLLDDIFSELDAKNRQRVLDLIQQTQTILTSAEEEILTLPEMAKADIIRLEEVNDW